MPQALASPPCATATRESATTVAAERQKFHLILDVLPPYIVLLSPDYRVVFANREFRKRFGDPGKRLCYDLLFGLSQPCEKCETFTVLQTGSSHNWEWTGPDGRRYDIYDFPFTDTDGSRLILEMGIDVTDRKVAEEAVRTSEAQLRAFIDHSPLGICRTSVDEDRFVMVNPALVQMLGYDSADQLLALRISTDVYRDPTERPRMLDRVRAKERFEGIELHWKRRDGSPITLRASGRWVGESAFEDAFLEYLVEDITEYRQLEERLRQIQKLDAIGRMAGGVAHDFNNLLMIINSYAELMLQKLGSADPLRRYPDQIQIAGRRAMTLTSQLLAFSRSQVLGLGSIDVNSMLGEMVQTLPRLIGEDIRLKVVPGKEVPAIRADRGQLEQVFLNLATNARDAMPSGGVLVIETSSVVLDSSFCATHALKTPGTYVLISVSDTGCGISSEVLPHIFEPFFTTKERGKGTGLGLSTAYGIIKQFGGAIWAYSEPGHGTSFKMYFPASEREVSAKAAEQEEAEEIVPSGSETVLLVEDEDALRQSTREGLESLGYNVLDAANGEEALAIAASFESTIHLVLTDLVMPGINGKALADRLCDLRPRLRVLYMSGYSNGILQQRGIVGKDVFFLQKPFHLAALAQKLRQVLSSDEGIARTPAQAKESHAPSADVNAVDWKAEIEALETHLAAIEQATARTAVPSEVLNELRSALDHCRTALWAAAGITKEKDGD